MSAPPETTEAPAERKPNGLVNETSPYLLQHAYNPVQWHPWGPKAFEEARRRGVPIFLSIGYSTCYWCHVMERESFENDEIAAIMNERFVCIKVDREERPDVDDIYMAAVQVITGRGGWPMSMWLTPPGARGEDDRGLQPFYGGTYFPAESRGGMPAFPDLLKGISDAWNNKRADMLEQAKQVTDAVQTRLAQRAAPVNVGQMQIGQAISALLQMYDSQDGGYGRAPKFPQPVYPTFLLDAVGTIDDPAIRGSVKRSLRYTLDRMAMGGMYDQVGGGFHRYSTDAKWLVPHFEKMLYDNGQLVSLYARSFLREDSAGGGDLFDARVIWRTLDYVLAEMTSEQGAFFSAQDAEVDGHEGQNYLWSEQEIVDVLGDDAPLAIKAYGVSQGPNFKDPHHPEDQKKNVLFLIDRPDRIAASMGLSLGEFEAKLDSINRRLLAARAKRKQPRLDDKVLTAWNGLMIAGMADGARALGEPKYLEAGQRAAAFVLANMRDKDGGLLRSYRAGVAKTPAFLEDSAMLIRGLLALHIAATDLGLDTKDHLAKASELAWAAIERFEDPSHPGVLYDTLPNQSDLIVRTMSTYDGAVPSGQSVILNDLITLHELTGEDRFLNKAVEVLAALSEAIRRNPPSPIEATRGLHRLLTSDPAMVAALAGPADTDENVDKDVVRVDEPPVQIFAATDRITVPPGKAVGVPIELRIAKGFHVTTNDPGLPDLVPMEITVRGGTGVSASVDYPRGDLYTGEAVPPEDRGKMRIYTGTVRMNVMLSRTDEAWSGRPLITVTYQACDDQACFQPMTVELDVAIDPG